MPVDLRVPASVEPHVSVTIKAEVPGILKQVFVREGQAVRKGEVLFEIASEPYLAALRQVTAQLDRDTAEVQQVQANIERDRAQARNARRQAERYTKLLAEGVISREQFDLFNTNAQMADQTLAADQAALEVAKATTSVDRAAVQRARVDLDHCTIRSPIEGVAGYLATHFGNIIKGNADTPLVTINEVQPAFVSFALPDRFLDLVRRRLENGPLTLHVYTPGGGPELTSGPVNLLDNTVDSTTGTIRMKALVGNQDQRLWPGQSVEVILTLSTEKGVVTIPKAALQEGEQGFYVFALKNDQTVDLRSVKIGAEAHDKVSILEGVRDGDVVVIDGQSQLRSGVKVKVVSESIVKSGLGQ